MLLLCSVYHTQHNYFTIAFYFCINQSLSQIESVRFLEERPSLHSVLM